MNHCPRQFFAYREVLGILLLATFPISWVRIAAAADEHWARHTIDDQSRGADGVRLADFNGDGYPDIVTGWEEAGVVRICFHPGPRRARTRWPAVTVGRAGSPEDALAVDLDGDGSLDVVSCHEGSEKSIWFHWGPTLDSDSVDPNPILLDADRWTSDAVESTIGKGRWMFAIACDVDRRHGIDLIVGSKDKGGMVGWLESPEHPRQTAAWKLHRIEPAGWIMSLAALDFDGDDDLDILVTDRKGKRRGLYWIEKEICPEVRPLGAEPVIEWTRHDIGAEDKELMFAQATTNTDGIVQSVWITTRNDQFGVFSRHRGEAGWHAQYFDNPFGIRCGKAIAVSPLATADAQRAPTLQNDATRSENRLLAVSNNTAASDLANQQPAVAMTQIRRERAGEWRPGEWRDVSGLEGVKFDLIHWVDLDGDGDLDLLTCEERDNLGVVWYENPY